MWMQSLVTAYINCWCLFISKNCAMGPHQGFPRSGKQESGKSISMSGKSPEISYLVGEFSDSNKIRGKSGYFVVAKHCIIIL